MKKTICLILVFVMALISVSCGTSTTKTTESSSKTNGSSVVSSTVSSSESSQQNTSSVVSSETSKQTNTTSSSKESKSSSNSKTYTGISNFSITGKWQNVGEGTFGQAQKNAIIVFDGANCNFFSPKDTYSISKDGQNYKLYCTSVLSTATLSFTVKTIDKDNIDIYYGSTIVELKRVT